MKTQVGTIYKTDGSVEKIYPKKGRKIDYDQLSSAVGGYIESLIPGIKGCRQMFCNEDGLLLKLPPNPHTWNLVKASVYKLNGYPSYWRVSGNIIAITNEEVKDETKTNGTAKDSQTLGS